MNGINGHCPAGTLRGIYCPRCNTGAPLPVTHTERLGVGAVRRRRKCKHCAYRVVTVERVTRPAK